MGKQATLEKTRRGKKFTTVAETKKKRVEIRGGKRSQSQRVNGSKKPNSVAENLKERGATREKWQETLKNCLGKTAPP